VAADHDVTKLMAETWKKVDAVCASGEPAFAHVTNEASGCRGAARGAFPSGSGGNEEMRIGPAGVFVLGVDRDGNAASAPSRSYRGEDRLHDL
jgi:hypothetical protein